MAASAPASTDLNRVNLSWLARLRWYTLAGHAVIIAIVHFALGTQLPLLPLGVILCLELVSNVVARRWLASPSPQVGEPTVASFVAIDLVLFTALLYFTGGPFNPFSFLYLIHLALAALFLSSRWTWSLVALALCCSGALFLHHVPLSLVDHSAEVATQASSMLHAGHAQHMHEHMGHGAHAAPPGSGGHGAHGEAMDAHLYGMWIAMGLAASAIVYFMHQIRGSMHQRDAELEIERERGRRHEQLASLATLAAGAAHELSSPLATIAVISKELDRELSASEPDSHAVQELRVIRDQVNRCREILSQMSTDAGQPIGEMRTGLTPRELVDRAISTLENERVEVHLEGSEDEPARLPAQALARAVRGLVKNALDASDGSVELRVTAQPDSWKIEVRDMGAGMTEEVRRRAIEPFFTTKDPGKGMGLGLFLTRAVADGLGGELELASTPGAGTTATLRLPVGRDDDDSLAGAA